MLSTEAPQQNLEAPQEAAGPPQEILEAPQESERGGNFSLTQIREAIPNGGYRLKPIFLKTGKRKSSCGLPVNPW